MTAIAFNQTTYFSAIVPTHFEGGSVQGIPALSRVDTPPEITILDSGKIISTGDLATRERNSVQVLALPKIVISTFIISIFFALLGTLSLLFFALKDVYFIHPYMSLISFVGGSFLFSSSLLATKGK